MEDVYLVALRAISKKMSKELSDRNREDGATDSDEYVPGDVRYRILHIVT